MLKEQRTRQNDRKPGQGLPPGTQHYRAWVGSPDVYDLMSAGQFNLLTSIGLRESHKLLDIGCGSLRAGKLFIPYLLPRHYFGIEPEQWLLDEGIDFEIGADLIKIKQPTFSNDRDFTCTIFGEKFDFLLAQSIFTHASQNQIRQCMSQAHRSMDSDSVFVATFIEGTKDYSEEEWIYPENVTYTTHCLKQIARDCGLILKTLEWPYPGQQTWIAMVKDSHKEEINTRLANLSEAAMLWTELAYHQDRLARITQHPYVRLGFRLHTILNKLLRPFRIRPR